MGLALSLVASLPATASASDDGAGDSGIRRSLGPPSVSSGNRILPQPRNPYITIGGSKVNITWMTGEIEFVPVDQFITELNTLPNWAWPEGRRVLLWRPGLRQRGTSKAIDATFHAVKALLERHGFVVGVVVE